MRLPVAPNRPSGKRRGRESETPGGLTQPKRSRRSLFPLLNACITGSFRVQANLTLSSV